ncbi:MAG: DNRLRE domain-containing protein [bacterium]
MKRRFIVLNIVAFSILLSLSSVPASASIIEAIDDNFVIHTQPNTVQSSTAILAVKRDKYTISPARKAWISFDISSLGLTDEHRSVDAASFLITEASNGGHYTKKVLSFNVFGLTNEAGDYWSEDTLTWNNAPGNNSTFHSVDPSQTTYLGSFSFFDNAAAVGSQLSISSNALIDFLHADTNGLVTLIVTRTTTHEYPTHFESSETGVAGISTPRLDVDLAAVPIPGAWLLLLSGLLGMVGVKKKFC